MNKLGYACWAAELALERSRCYKLACEQGFLHCVLKKGATGGLSSACSGWILPTWGTFLNIFFLACPVCAKLGGPRAVLNYRKARASNGAGEGLRRCARALEAFALGERRSAALVIPAGVLLEMR